MVAAGRRKHFYVFDLAAAAVERVAGLTGRPERSLESFAACAAADNPLIAFLGNQVPSIRKDTALAVGLCHRWAHARWVRVWGIFFVCTSSRPIIRC